VYLKKTDWKVALQMLHDEFSSAYPLSAEIIPVQDALHRIASKGVTARLSLPHYDSAAMDGIAVKAEDTFGASAANPKIFTVGADVEFINTGDPIKKKFDAVIKIEDVITIDDTRVEIRHSVPPAKDIRFEGEDFKADDVILPENHIIRPIDIGAMLSCGVLDVEVRRKPKVSIIPTGSEIVEPKEKLEIGEIIDCNSYIAANMIKEWGGVPVRHSIVRNDKEEIEEAVGQGVSENDMVIVIAGSSAGTEDYTLSVVEEMGKTIVHGVDLMPGKPVILAEIENKPVIGLPGYPVSAFVILDIFVKELIAMALGILLPKKEKINAILDENITSKLGMDEVVRVRLSNKNGRVYAVPLKRGAGILSSLVQADGLLHIAKDREGINEGDEMAVELMKRVIELES